MLPRLILACLIVLPIAGRAQTYTPLYAWQPADYDWNPNADLLPTGRAVFGTVEFNAAGFENPHDTGCGGYGCGSVYRIAGGALTTLYAFSGADGGMPIAGLAGGNTQLFGTTSYGGARCAVVPEHCGTVFALDPAARRLTTLHAFSGLADGGGSYAKPVLYKGMLYGTASVGGSITGCGGQGCGTIFRLDPATGKFTTLHRFTAADGTGHPETALTPLDGALFGTTAGYQDGGTVFRLDPGSGQVTLLHRFGQGADGLLPSAGLVACAGALYGTTQGGGAYGFGTLFKLDPHSGTETIVHAFAGDLDGYNPSGPLAVHAGTVYGAVAYTYLPAPPQFPWPVQAGNIYQLDCATGVETIVMGFSFDNGVDGQTPLGVSYYGGALYGIMRDSGGVFEFGNNQSVTLGLAFTLVP